jgi:DNA-binding CsgD family transcriptional regulator
MQTNQVPRHLSRSSQEWCLPDLEPSAVESYAVRITGAGVQHSAYTVFLASVTQLRLVSEDHAVAILFSNCWEAELQFTAGATREHSLAHSVLLHSGEREDIAAAYRAGIRVFVFSGEDLSALLQAIAKAAIGEPYVSPASACQIMAGLCVSSPVPPQTDEETLVLRLTDRQAEIAGLAAAGMATKQIARALMLSEAGVKYHLGRIFETLGIARREQLRGFRPYLQRDGFPCPVR